MAHYHLHGLQISSDVPLPEPEATVRDIPDLVIRRDSDRAVERLGESGLELRRTIGGEVFYEASKVDESWTIQVPGRVGIRLTGGDLAVWRAPEADEHIIPLLLAGLGLAFVMTVREQLCLHASAIEADGHCVAFGAPGGFGKTTLALLACACGSPFFADDVLRVDLGEGDPVARRGACEARLRQGAALAAEWFTGLTRATADGRTAVAPPRSSKERLPLSALVVPVLAGARDEVVVDRLRGLEAFSALLGCVRLLGWRNSAILARQFDQFVTLASRVPVLSVRVPWRSPLERGVGATVVERVLEAIDGA